MSIVRVYKNSEPFSYSRLIISPLYLSLFISDVHYHICELCERIIIGEICILKSAENCDIYIDFGFNAKYV